jgi:prepilin-type processing-associated H-X9-DG protein
MPKLSNFKYTARTVLMFDCMFSPSERNPVNNFNSVNPANRWRSFSTRHMSSGASGGNINFIDGHAQFFKSATVTNLGAGNEVAGHPLIWNQPYRQQVVGF